MSKIIFTIIFGIIIGIIDVIPMIIKKLSRQSIVSAFLHYFFVTIIIICIDLPVLPWFIEGGVVSFELALQIAILVSENDKKSVPIILYTSIILGIIISVVGNYFK